MIHRWINVSEELLEQGKISQRVEFQKFLSERETWKELLQRVLLILIIRETLASVTRRLLRETSHGR